MKIKLPDQTLDIKLNISVSTHWIILFLFLLSLGFRLVFINKGFFHHDAILFMDAIQESVAQ